MIGHTTAPIDNSRSYLMKSTAPVLEHGAEPASLLAPQLPIVDIGMAARRFD
jgi:hypothetical protein